MMDTAPKTTTALTVVETKPSVRTIARQQGIDLGLLLDILKVRRPDQSKEEATFVGDFIRPIKGMKIDDFGNLYLTVGEKPTVMWSCHTDTVSDEGGMQNLKWDGDVLSLNQPKKGQSLGADDGAGIWLMLEMIKAGKEGLYIFHRAEEVGGLGSSDIVKNHPELVDGIQMAIAFDRKATHSVITYQRGKRCCSDEFGNALAKALNEGAEGLAYKLDSGGVFTDTANYTKLIAECTNLSAGYYNEHTERETLDVAHLFRLREALLKLDVSQLPIKRDPTVVEPSSWGGYGGGYSGYGNWGRQSWSTGDKELDGIVDVIEDHPFAIGRWMRRMGLDAAMLRQLIFQPQPVQPQPAKPAPLPKTREDGDVQWAGALADYFADRPHLAPDNDLADPDADEEERDIVEEEALYCLSCGTVTTSSELMAWPHEGDECSACDSRETEVIDVQIDDNTGEIVGEFTGA